MNLEEAYAECTRLATSHYENFPVGRLVPPDLRPHVHAVYSFARYADDMADEGYSNFFVNGSTLQQALTFEERLKALEDWQALLLKPVTPDSPATFIALDHTRKTFDLPVSLFTDLISAFRQDVMKRRYANFAEVLDYCTRSANPIGRLVLLLHGQRDPIQHELSDAICTGLQLANFWQDVGVDLKKDRIYLPEDERQEFGVTEEDLFAYHCTPGYRKLLAFQVERTRKIFEKGEALCETLPGKLRWEIRMTWLGGTGILDRIEDLNYNTLQNRPKLTKWDVLPLVLQALAA